MLIFSSLKDVIKQPNNIDKKEDSWKYQQAIFGIIKKLQEN